MPYRRSTGKKGKPQTIVTSAVIIPFTHFEYAASVGRWHLAEGDTNKKEYAIECISAYCI